MKDYLRALIIEQINRGLCLKEMAQYREYPVLTGLAERCKMIIDSNIQDLRFYLRELEGRQDNDLRDLFRDVRICIREIELIEYFGISVLHFETPDVGYLSNLLFKIHKEIKLPLNPPAVACISTRYYYFHPFTNVIFVPVGESRFLLHLPDVFHEIGHQVLTYKDNELALVKVADNYEQAIKKITIYYENLRNQKLRETGPRSTPLILSNIHYQWKTYWINEFFCDLFALYTLGPAYAWAHIHLTAKKAENVYEFSEIFPSSHPSDEARMKMLIIAVKKIGFDDTASMLLSRWNDLPIVHSTQPVTEYQYAYPEDLMSEIADLFLQSLKDSDFAIISRKRLNEEKESIISLLNEAWTLFRTDPQNFINWEAVTVQKLKNELGS